MADERCPWCGAERYGGWSWACYTLVSAEEPQRSVSCRVREGDQLRARVTRLESALRCIRQYGPFKSFTWIDRTIDEALSDTHGPGTVAGDAAREGMKG